MNAPQPRMTGVPVAAKTYPKPETEAQYAEALKTAAPIIEDATRLVMNLMADGRERTKGDMRNKLPLVSEKEIKRVVSVLTYCGALTVDYALPEYPIYKIARLSA